MASSFIPALAVKMPATGELRGGFISRHRVANAA